MGFTLSPLRYPGGKSRLIGFVRTILKANNLAGCEYVEPFAGGAGVAWALLLSDSVSKVHLNDLDPAIYAFWISVRDNTEELCRRIRDTRVTMAVWKRQREVLRDPSSFPLADLGFATFFLNRTNCSGVIRGGVIGGLSQTGKWKLNARYNRTDLLKRIERIAKRRDAIRIYAREARGFIRYVLPDISQNALVFIDPPYFSRGSDLYMNVYAETDHADLARLIVGSVKHRWIVSYDDAPEIKRMYKGLPKRSYSFSYSVNDRYLGSELLFSSPSLNVPKDALPSYPRKRGDHTHKAMPMKISELD